MISLGDSGWRAVYAEGFTLDRLEAIVAALTSLHSKQRALVGFDNRFLSEEFGHHAARVLAREGWSVAILPQIFPTPGVGTLVRKNSYDFGLVVTASHNPYYYNGLKILDRHGALIDRATADAIEKKANELLAVRPPARLPVGERFPVTVDFEKARTDYLRTVQGYVDGEVIRKSGLKVCWDAFGGTMTRLLPAFLDAFGIRHEPVPTVEEPTYGKRRLEPDAVSLKDLGALVGRSGAAIGIATDVDGDRFSAVDQTGAYVQNNPLGSLLAWYLLHIRKERGTVYQTVSCSSLTEKIARLHDAPVEIVPVGFQKMGRRMVEDPKPLMGIEETGGLAYGPHVPFKDGLVAAALLLEMLATQKKTVTELIDQLRRTYGFFHYDRVDLKLSSEPEILPWLERSAWETKLKEDIVAVSTLDGIKWTFASGGWVLVRRSKTEPLIRIYFESEDPAFLEKVSKAVRAGRT